MITFLNRSPNLRWSLNKPIEVIKLKNSNFNQNINSNQAYNCSQISHQNKNHIKIPIGHFSHLSYSKIDTVKSFNNLYMWCFSKPFIKQFQSSFNLCFTLSYAFKTEKREIKQKKSLNDKNERWLEWQKKVEVANKQNQNKQPLFQSIIKQFIERKGQFSIFSHWCYLKLIINLYISQNHAKLDFFHQNNSDFKHLIDSLIKKAKTPQCTQIVLYTIYKQMSFFKRLKNNQNKIVDILIRQFEKTVFLNTQQMMNYRNLTVILKVLSYEQEMNQNLKNRYLQVYKHLQNHFKLNNPKQTELFKFLSNESKQRKHIKIENNRKILQYPKKVFYYIFKCLNRIQKEEKINPDILFCYLCKPFETYGRQYNLIFLLLPQLRQIFIFMSHYLKQNPSKKRQQFWIVFKQILKRDTIINKNSFQFNCCFIYQIVNIFKSLQLKKDLKKDKGENKQLQEYLLKMEDYVLNILNHSFIQNLQQDKISNSIQKINVFLFIMSSENKIYNMNLYQKIFQLLTLESSINQYSMLNILNIIQYGLLKLSIQDRRKMKKYENILWHQFWNLYLDKFTLKQKGIKKQIEKLIIASFKKHSVLIKAPKDINLKSFIEKQEIIQEISEFIRNQANQDQGVKQNESILTKHKKQNLFQSQKYNKQKQFKELYDKFQEINEQKKFDEIDDQQFYLNKNKAIIKFLFHKVKRYADTNGKRQKLSKIIQNRSRQQKLEKTKSENPSLIQQQDSVFRGRSFIKKRKQVYESLVRQQLKYQQKKYEKDKRINPN